MSGDMRIKLMGTTGEFDSLFISNEQQIDKRKREIKLRQKAITREAAILSAEFKDLAIENSKLDIAKDKRKNK